MAFKEKLGQFAGKARDVAGDTLDYGKAKGKIVVERNKIKDVKEAIGEYVYDTVHEEGLEALDMERIKAFCDEIEQHAAEIERLAQDAKDSSASLSSHFDSDKRKEDKKTDEQEDADADSCQEAQADDREVEQKDGQAD